MPADMQKLLQNKDLIIATIQSKGPSLPVHLARATNLSILFASAFLSELFSEKRVKMSNMRVGSSPLYFLEGQEPLLENFIEYLNHKEKEAFSLLKKQKILQDELQEPAIRVALREIKDFVVPFKISINNEEKLFWKYYLVPDKNVREILFNLQTKKQKKETKQEISTSIITQFTKLQPLPLSQTQILATSNMQDVQLVNKKTKKIKSPDLKFVNSIKDYLAGKNIEILETKEEKSKQLTAKVRIDTLFGKQEYLLIAKDKKKIGEEDLISALHKAQLEKMPALLIAPGDIDKKSLDSAKLWRNLVKFEKVKF